VIDFIPAAWKHAGAMRYRPFLTLALTFTLGAAVTAAPARAAETNRLHPAPDRGSGFVAIHSATPVGQLGLSAGLFGGQTCCPLTLDAVDLAGASYEANGRVITDQSMLHLLVAFGLHEDFDIGLDLPLLLFQQGENLAGLDNPLGLSAGPGLDDLRLVPRWRAFGLRFSEGFGVAVAALVDVGFPTGDAAELRGGTWRATPMLAVESFLPAGFRATINAGFAFQEEERVVSHKVEHHPSVGFGIDAPVVGPLHLLLEGQHDVTSEARAAFRAGWGRWRVEVGAGAGLPDDTDSPKWRVFGGFSCDILLPEEEPAPAGDKVSDMPGVPAWRQEWSGTGARQHAVDVIVHFETSATGISRPERPELDRVAGTLIATPATGHVWVEGHADNEGDPHFNLDLSKRRAEAVRYYLVARGVAGSRLSAVGLGQSQPLDHNDNPEGRKANRRVEFRVAPKSEPPAMPVVEQGAAPAQPRTAEAAKPEPKPKPKAETGSKSRSKSKTKPKSRSKAKARTKAILD
jgi:outer membrane protein OmpA-like peptidoglycan-associated protein